jgi:cytochrome bd-type quinol oxidase subunit 2
MSQTTTGIGLALSMLGVGAFFASARKHVTSLIPAFLGIVLTALGVAGRKEEFKQGARAGAIGISLVGLLVSAQGLFFPQLFPATDVPREDVPMRGAVQIMTAVLCALHLGDVARTLAQGGQDGG